MRDRKNTAAASYNTQFVGVHVYLAIVFKVQVNLFIFCRVHVDSC